eukprot:TRINITY_DN1376_c0_g1_i6.p3 TRINITY_DN1376_c0_g1~~TRINITY_DN1376_c0_g1_i6.p3  ORF type:complete len:109 (-),score=5.28 TRINITY_DN1376_c0_g1_i6:40-366(-)
MVIEAPVCYKIGLSTRDFPADDPGYVNSSLAYEETAKFYDQRSSGEITLGSIGELFQVVECMRSRRKKKKTKKGQEEVSDTTTKGSQEKGSDNRKNGENNREEGTIGR